MIVGLVTLGAIIFLSYMGANRRSMRRTRLRRKHA